MKAEVEEAVRLLVGQVGFAEVGDPGGLVGGPASCEVSFDLKQDGGAGSFVSSSCVCTGQDGTEGGPDCGRALMLGAAQRGSGETGGLIGIAAVQGEVGEADRDQVAAVVRSPVRVTISNARR